MSTEPCVLNVAAALPGFGSGRLLGFLSFARGAVAPAGPLEPLRRHQAVLHGEEAEQAGGNWDIWVMSADGGGQQPLTADAGYNAQPSVSPDGRRIAFASSRAAGVFNNKSLFSPWKVSVEGGEPAQLTDRDCRRPSVSPDGQSITYPANRDGIANICSQPLGGSPAKQLTDFKAEGRLRFDWSRDGKQLVLSRHVRTSDLVLLRNFGPGQT